jgi:hypothetical protein
MSKSENGTIISSQWQKMTGPMRSTFSLNSADTTLGKVRENV